MSRNPPTLPPAHQLTFAEQQQARRTASLYRQRYPQPGDRYPHPGELYGGAIYPNHGYPPNPGEDRPGLSPYGRLAKGQPLGKKSILNYKANAVDANQNSQVTILRLEGDDLDASQLIITISPPSVIPISQDRADELIARFGEQNISGEQDNQEVGDDDFPDTGAPIAWPPLECEIEWGIKGASYKMNVDVTNGCAFSINASFVNVRAKVTQSQTTGEITGTSALYVISAFIGPGVCQSQAKRTIFVKSIDVNAESDVYAVPKFARRAYIVGCDDTTPPAVSVFYLRFWQSPDGNAGNTNVGNFFVSGNQPLAFPVPNAGQYFSCFNQSGSGMKCAVIFELDPG